MEGKCCPECGSDQLRRYGKKWVKRDGVRVEVQQFQCKNCGRITINPVEEKK